jgi:hypothetical protein
VVLNAPLSTEIAVQAPLISTYINPELFHPFLLGRLFAPFQTIVLDHRRQSCLSVIGINNNHTQIRAERKQLSSTASSGKFRKQKHHPTCVAVVSKLLSSCLLHRLSISKRFS